MKSQSLIFFLLISVTPCWCQDSSLVVLPDMVNKTSDALVISDHAGWIFKKGHDLSWANQDIDTAGWIKLNPRQINRDLADEDGRFEGWFRLKILIDSSSNKKIVGISFETWAAIDFYLDGRRVSSLGRTGQYNAGYQEYRRNQLLDAITINLEAGEHWISLHVVDYRSPLFQNRLKSEFEQSTVIRLIGQNYQPYLIDVYHEATVYTTLWISVAATLSLLFWIMVLATPFEKRLILLASCVTCLTFAMMLSTYARYPFGFSFETRMILTHATNFLVAGYLILTIIIIAATTKNRISKGLVANLALLLILGIVDNLLPGTTGRAIGILFALTCAYYTVISWKSLNGAQWAIVSGVLITALSFVVYLIGFFHYNNQILYPFAYIYLTGVALSFPLSLLIYLAMRFKENIKEIQAKANLVIQLLEEKKEQALTQQKVLEEEVLRQTVELRTSLENLKATQSQLVQSEKMASLGELTAGIAHEIQNPLNFVNNFSEVNKELVEELAQGLKAGKIEDAIAIAKDIKENEEKINQHGKRADAIVKSMLQHSRKSTGQKEPTDINALCDEYLRLAYHGLRAKDKSFNTRFETNLDPNLPKISVQPQDFGRVILNLINNAFYAVNDKAKQRAPAYQPQVTVSTKNAGNKVQITIKDNGAGISDSVKEKIFQPFFTTKPTGQGTGLGLSLSYDIVKAHGGELKVETKEGEGSEFIINLPL